jgi:hypothetical protein
MKAHCHAKTPAGHQEGRVSEQKDGGKNYRNGKNATADGRVLCMEYIRVRWLAFPDPGFIGVARFHMRSDRAKTAVRLDLYL